MVLFMKQEETDFDYNWFILFYNTCHSVYVQTNFIDNCLLLLLLCYYCTTTHIYIESEIYN